MSGHNIGGALRRTPAISNLKKIFALDAGASTSMLARLGAGKKKVKGPTSTTDAAHHGKDNTLNLAAQLNRDDISTHVGDSDSNTDSGSDTTVTQIPAMGDDHDLSAASNASDNLCKPDSIHRPYSWREVVQASRPRPPSRLR